MQESARAMIEGGGGGSIVVTSSQNAFFPQYDTSHYSATKGALLTLVRATALDLSANGVRVNAISPGFIRTPLAAPLLDDRDTAARLLRTVPMGRFGESEEIANAVLFLASDQASYITGANLVADGGATLGMSLGVERVVLPGFAR
jgi:NAD(P)-dependent dehydrogenase (short-subunit alcohol dehydrogenase family)